MFFVCYFTFKCISASYINTHSPSHPLFFPSAVHIDNPPSIPTLTTSYVHGLSSHSLLSSTVDQCLQATVERYPDREAMVFVQDGIRKTFAEFYQDVSISASGFSTEYWLENLLLSVMGKRKTTLSKGHCVE